MCSDLVVDITHRYDHVITYNVFRHEQLMTDVPVLPGKWP